MRLQETPRTPSRGLQDALNGSLGSPRGVKTAPTRLSNTTKHQTTITQCSNHSGKTMHGPCLQDMRHVPMGVMPMLVVWLFLSSPVNNYFAIGQ